MGEFEQEEVVVLERGHVLLNFLCRVIQDQDYSVTLGLSRNRSVGRIKGNQATFDNSQRNNLRSCMWVSEVVFG